MDPANERIEPNDPLRSLFQEVGHVQAPDHMDNSILQQLVTPGLARASQQPLITGKGWIIVAAIVAFVIIASVTSTIGTTSDSTRMQWMHLPELTKFLASRWVLATAAGALALTLIDQVITQRVRTFYAF